MARTEIMASRLRLESPAPSCRFVIMSRKCSRITLYNANNFGIMFAVLVNHTPAGSIKHSVESYRLTSGFSFA
jgi:hypothetical protein